jgi:hypothetical protein
MFKFLEFNENTSIVEDRKRPFYRILESLLFVVSSGFLLSYILLSFISPTIASLFIIIYSALWLCKAFLNVIYTIYTYKQFNRYNQINWIEVIENFSNIDYMNQYFLDLMVKYKNRLDFNQKIEIDINTYKQIQNSKYIEPKNIINVCVFATYNESTNVLKKSLICLKESSWNLSNLIIIVSQEARNGAMNNSTLREKIAEEDFVNCVYLDELNSYKDVKIADNKLNVYFTEHPDGIIGEIKGKASNEDWGARKGSQLLDEKHIDPEMVLVTSLDADSHISKYFFHNLAYKYCLTLDRARAGFQPVHVYSNNFFDIGLFPRQIATQTTLYNMTTLTLDGEIYFFAIYSVPLTVLRDVDYWVKEIIAEDYLLFIKCLTYYKGDFRIVSHYGLFEGDAIEAEDYIEEIVYQYKQLQRWAWGGVEGFPYLIKRLFLTKESKQIPLKTKLKWAYYKFSNHFFWVTTPLIFSVGPLLPGIIYGENFKSSTVAQNVSTFSIFFIWISFIFTSVFMFLTIKFLGRKAKKDKQLNFIELSKILIQFAVSPIIYGFMALPALDAQARGFLGKYMGYWVTPKK